MQKANLLRPMSDSNYKFLLILFQYVSIIISGTLGIMSLYFDFKIKKTGKLNRWGTMASLVLIFSLAIGVVSKSIEVKVQNKQDKASEAKEANLRDQLARIQSKVNTIDMVFEFTIPLNSKVFVNYRSAIQKKIGEWGGDQHFSPEQFASLIKDKSWKQTVQELSYFTPVMEIYPKGTTIPECVNEPPKLPFDGKDHRTGLWYSVKTNIKAFEYPRNEELVLVKSNGQVTRDKETGPANLSTVDFDGATIKVYVETPTTYQPSDKPGKPGVFHFDELAALHYDHCSLMIYFDQDRMARVKDFRYKIDKCSNLPYFIGHIQVRN